MSLTPSIKLNYLDQVLQSTQVFVSKPQPSEKLQNKYNICKCSLLVPSCFILNSCFHLKIHNTELDRIWVDVRDGP